MKHTWDFGAFRWWTWRYIYFMCMRRYYVYSSVSLSLMLHLQVLEIFHFQHFLFLKTNISVLSRHAFSCQVGKNPLSVRSLEQQSADPWAKCTIWCNVWLKNEKCNNEHWSWKTLIYFVLLILQMKAVLTKVAGLSLG